MNPLAASASSEVPEKPRLGLSRLFSCLKNLPLGYSNHLFMHLGCLAIFFAGVSPRDLFLCVGLYLLRMFAITGGYHRYFSHRTYKTSRVFQFLLGWLGCTAMQRGPLWWAAVHRYHHCHSDTADDIHSPLLRGFWWSHIGWVLADSPDEIDWGKVRDLSRYPELRWLERFCWLPAFMLAASCFFVGGFSGLVWGFIVSTVLVYHGTFTINSLGHLFGSRRYATADASRNNWLLALLTLGEGWHNNHHHYQSSANQGFFWWELDITYYLLLLLSWLRIVWDLRRPPARVLTRGLESGIRSQESGMKGRRFCPPSVAPDPWPLIPDSWR